MSREEAKHLSDVLKAYSEGKVIQKYFHSEGNWRDISILIKEDIIISGNDYRIKPEPKLRPYKNAEEFLSAQKEHGPYLKSISFGDYSAPIEILQDRVILRNNTLHFWGQLMRYNCWQDGSPCGIEMSSETDSTTD